MLLINAIGFGLRPLTGALRSSINPISGASKFSKSFNSFSRKVQLQSFTTVYERSQQCCCRVNGSLLTQQTLVFGIRHLKTSPKRDALPPVILVALTRVAKFVAVFVGRSMRIWWRKLSPEERAKYGKRITRNRYIMGGLLGGLGFGSFVYYESHIQETPFTNRKRFLAFNDEQFDIMSKFELEMMLQLHKDKIIPATLNLSSYRRVVNVAQQLLKANQDLEQIRKKQWTITVVDDQHNANAFVLPCGNIFVFSGLLKLCETDDELGIILGHEMAHAVLGHGAEKASFLHFLDLLLVLPLAALWAVLPTDLISGLGSFITATLTKLVMELPHSRFIEHEADQVGLILAAKACFDVRHCLVLWEKMSLIGPGIPGTEDLNLEWLSTHPSHDSRLQQLEEVLPSALGVREKCFCPRLQFYDAKAEVFKFEAKLKKQKKHPHEGLLLPVKIH